MRNRKTGEKVKEGKYLERHLQYNYTMMKRTIAKEILKNSNSRLKAYPQQLTDNEVSGVVAWNINRYQLSHVQTTNGSSPTLDKRRNP
ncbi:MAG: hypothetical protein V8Q76_10320 [Bacteroides intestinalis]